MDESQIVALLSGIEPSEGEIPKPPFMAAIPAGPVLDAGADIDAVDAWVKARGGWTHRTPAHLAGPDGERAPLFFIVPKGHLQAGGAAPARAAGSAAGPGAGGRGGAPSRPLTPLGAMLGATPATGAATAAGGLASASLVAFVATADMPAARAFYGHALGLKLTGQSPVACTFDAGGTTLRVAAVGEPVIAPYTVLGWTVSDIAVTIDDLTERGVDFATFDGVAQDERGIWNAPGGTRVAWFKDPDGNTLSLTQYG